MKNKSSNRRLSYSFTQRILVKDSNKMPELIKPPLEGTEIELENVLRWEDDGGKIIQTARSSKLIGFRIKESGTQSNIQKEQYDSPNHDRNQ